MCNGNTGDKWFEEYKDITDRLSEEDRQFSKPKNYNPVTDKKVPMSWTMGDEGREAFEIDSMYDCLESIDDTATKRAVYDRDVYKT